MVLAIIEILTNILPEKLFISIYQDIIKQAMEAAPGQTNFECVSALLLTLVSGQSCETLTPSAAAEMGTVEKPKLGTIKTGLMTGSVNQPLGALGAQAKKTAPFPASSSQTTVSDPF